MTLKTTFAASALAIGLLSGTGPANATVMIDIVEDGADVVATFDGTIDLAGLSLLGSTTIAFASMTPDSSTNPFGDRISPTFFSMPVGYDTYGTDATMPAFGTLDRTFSGTSQTGDSFGVKDYFVYVPRGYTSGDPIAGSMTFASKTFATLGLDEGTYTTTFSNGEQVVMTIAAAPDAAIPLPAGLPLLLAGLGGLGLVARGRTPKG